MKQLFHCLFFWGAGIAAFAQTVPFNRLGNPLVQTNLTLVWAASTNDLPKKLWVYAASPASVSKATISNLVAFGLFTDADKKIIPDNNHIISYTTPSGKKWLTIDTDWAFIDYSDPAANDMHITNGVPDRAQAFELAACWLPKLGIDESQLFPSPQGAKFYGGAEKVTFHPHGGGPAFATNICMYNVTFFRALDGVKIFGGSAFGGGEIEIGHDAKISKILVAWRNYSRDKLYATASPEKIMQSIRAGKAVWYPVEDSTVVDWSSAKKMTVEKITPHYYSDAYGMEKKPQAWACPFAELNASVDMGETKISVKLACPIVDLADF